MTTIQRRPIMVMLLSLSMLAAACSMSSAEPPAAIDESDERPAGSNGALTADDLRQLGDTTVVQVLVEPTRPGDDESNPIVELTASGGVSVWDDWTDSRLTGRVDAVEIAEHLEEFDAELTALGIGEEVEGCVKLVFEWLRPDLERARTEVCFDPDNDEIGWEIQTAAVRLIAPDIAEEIEAHDAELDLLESELDDTESVVLSFTSAWVDEPANPYLEIHASGAATVWDETQGVHLTGTLDPAVVEDHRRAVQLAGQVHQWDGDVEATSPDCPGFNYSWVDEDGFTASGYTNCDQFDEHPDLHAAFVVVYLDVLNTLGGSLGAETEPTESDHAGADLTTLGAYVGHADGAYLNGAGFEDRVRQLEANCATLDRLTEIAGNVARRPANMPDFLVQHLFVCPDLVTQLDVSFEREFTEDIVGLGVLSTFTNGAVDDDERFGRFVERLRSNCADHDLLRSTIVDGVEPVAWLAGWHAFVCPEAVMALGPTTD